MNKHQKKLKQFYVDIANWINEGTPDHPVFVRTQALCLNLYYWLESRPWYEKIFINEKAVQLQQIDNFYKIYKNASFPFGGETVYVKDSLMESHYSNIERLAYIFLHAGIDRNETQR